MKKKFILCAFICLLVITTITILFVVIYNNSFHETQIILDSKYLPLLSVDETKSKVKVLSEYTTDSTVGYLNKDGTKSIYVYSSPVNYKKDNGLFATIDTRLKNTGEGNMRNLGYVYTVAESDCPSYFPNYLSEQKGIRLEGYNDLAVELSSPSDKKVPAVYQSYKNIIGNTATVVAYRDFDQTGSDLFCTPSTAGINLEMKLSKLADLSSCKFQLKVDDNDVQIRLDDAGYLILYHFVNGEEDILGILQPPILFQGDSLLSQTVFQPVRFQYQQKDEHLYELKFLLDSKLADYADAAVTAYWCAEIRREKQPDSAIYSEKPDFNSYLLNYAVLGNSEAAGLGKMRMRFRIAEPFKLTADQIKRATYSTTILGNRLEENDAIVMCSNEEDWCSMQSKWSNPIKEEGFGSAAVIKGNQLTLDLTDEVKKWCNDPSGNQEHYGITLKTSHQNKGSFCTVATNDNLLCTIKTEIVVY